jgi:hypothetical protein
MRNEIKFIQSFIEREKITGQEMLDVLAEIGLVSDIDLTEGDEITKTRRAWVPMSSHIHKWHWIRLVHGEPIGFIQCADPQCLASRQVDCPSDLAQLPVYSL